MSGTVVVDGQREPVGGRHRPRRPARRRRRRLRALRHLDEGRRHRRARLGRAHERVHGADGLPRRLRRRRRRARRLDLRGAPLRARRGRRASAPTASRRSCATSTSPSCARCSSAPGSTTPTRRLPPLRLGAPALPLPRRQRGGVLMATVERATGRPRDPGLRESATFDRDTIARDPARRARGHLRHPRLAAPSAGSRTSTTCCSSARACRATRSRATASAATPTSCSARATRRSRSQLDIPITIAGMSFGALSAPAKEALGRGASAVGTTHDDRRRRHDARGARALQDARLPAAALALRHEPRRPAPRRRDRGRRRPGRQARRRRDAARPEDLRPRRRDARPAGGHRPAQRLPAPGLDRPRRPRDQDRGAARDHRLGEADLRQGRRVAARTTTSRWRSRRAPT